MNADQYATNVAIREHWYAEVKRLRLQVETLLAACKRAEELTQYAESQPAIREVLRTAIQSIEGGAT